MDLTGKNVFLSGPMTNQPHCGVEAFARAHAIVKEHGARYVYNPANEYLTSSYQADAKPHEWWMRQCLMSLLRPTRCDEHPYFDYLISLHDWQKSDGARLERDVAMACGIKCIHISEVSDEG